MNEIIYKDLCKKTHLRKTMFFAGGIALFFAAIWTPAYHWIASDILLMMSPLPSIWDILKDVCHYLFYWVVLSGILYSYIHYGIEESKALFFSISVLSVVRYFANHVAGCFVIGFPSINDFFEYYLPYILLDIVLELVLMTISVTFIHLLLKKHISVKATTPERTTFLLGYLPHVTLFDLKNPIGKATMLVALVPSAFMILSRLIHDISAGFPIGLANTLLMLTFYIFDVLSVLLGYIIMIWLLHRSYMKDLKIKSEFESN